MSIRIFLDTLHQHIWPYKTINDNENARTVEYAEYVMLRTLLIAQNMCIQIEFTYEYLISFP